MKWSNDSLGKMRVYRQETKSLGELLLDKSGRHKLVNLGSNLKNICVNCAFPEKRFVAWQLQKSEKRERMLMIEMIELGFHESSISKGEWAIM